MQAGYSTADVELFRCERDSNLEIGFDEHAIMPEKLHDKYCMLTMYFKQ